MGISETAIADHLPPLDDDDWIDPERLERNEVILRGFMEMEEPWDDVILSMRRTGGELV